MVVNNSVEACKLFEEQSIHNYKATLLLNEAEREKQALAEFAIILELTK